MAASRGRPTTTGTPVTSPRSTRRRFSALIASPSALPRPEGEESVAGGQRQQRVVDPVPRALEGGQELLDGARVVVARDAPGGVAVEVAHQAGGHALVAAEELPELDRIGEGTAVELAGGIDDLA